MDNSCSPSLIIDDTHMLISSSVNQMAQLQPCRYSGFILSIVFHFTLVISYFYITQQRPVIIHQPAPAVMLSLSENVQAVNKEKQIVGVDQQMAVASQKKQQQEIAEKQPNLIINENADILLEKPKKVLQNQTSVKVAPSIAPTKPSPIVSENVSSLSAPSTSHSVAKQQANDVSANYDSDANKEADALALWQAKAKGHLNRYKAYPEEAKRKGRTGAPKVRFIVDGQGYVIACELINSSGVRSLDKEAQSVIKRAQPLPKPPEELLFNGQITIEMAIEFSTLTL
ncbi:TPA: TonB family protein [Proteus mirabilis]|uniref:TonB family protein n=1 Tax=Proteus mirabilis TaxID=584 RepID=UPI0021AB334C|nr:TonB family protein [Proteus mirabilis]MDC9786426.1 TonB family protein [Proteus mirabilis]